MDKLGKGLGALFGENFADIDSDDYGNGRKGSNGNHDRGGITSIPISQIDNNVNQPRKNFDENTMQELVNSIKEHGVIQPVIVVKVGTRYMLVAGERRWRASKTVGLTEIPAIIKEYTPKQIAEISIIENLQRDDLNDIEVALGIKKLMEEFDLTQERVAERLGKTRSTVANLLRMLNLPEDVQRMISNKLISYGHAIRLLSVSSPERQSDYAKAAVKGCLSVRALEQLIEAAEAKHKIMSDKKMNPKPVETKEEERLLSIKLNTKVEILGSNRIGKIMISYFSKEELERITESILGK